MSIPSWRTAFRFASLAPLLGCAEAADLAVEGVQIALTPSERRVDVVCPPPAMKPDSLFHVVGAVALLGADLRPKGADTLDWEDSPNCDDDDDECDQIPVISREPFMAMVHTDIQRSLERRGILVDSTALTTFQLTFQLQKAEIRYVQKPWHRMRVIGEYHLDLRASDANSADLWSGTIRVQGDSVKAMFPDHHDVAKAMSDARCQFVAALDSVFVEEEFRLAIGLQ